MAYVQWASGIGGNKLYLHFAHSKNMRSKSASLSFAASYVRNGFLPHAMQKSWYWTRSSLHFTQIVAGHCEHWTGASTTRLQTPHTK